VTGDARITGILTIGTGSITLDGSNNQLKVGTGVTITTNGIVGITSINSGPISGSRNLIINGDMRIDQRNAGAAVTINGGSNFAVDRFSLQDDTDGSFTGQRSTTAPGGFTNSLLITVTSSDSTLGSTQVARILHRIEGFNIQELEFGTANASTVTLSFWVRSSETGTYGGSLANSAFNRIYPFTYAITTANTFEYKTITIAGDITGTWLTDSGMGLEINFSLGTGSTYSGTANAWTSSGVISSTGAKNLMATNGATFYITGVQLEAGSVATLFERRPIGMELALCQRYFEIIGAGQSGVWWNVSDCSLGGKFAVAKRVTPTASLLNTSPRVVEAGIAQRTGTNSTIYGVNIDTQGIRYDCSGFSGATIGKGAIVESMSLAISAEL